MPQWKRKASMPLRWRWLHRRCRRRIPRLGTALNLSILLDELLQVRILSLVSTLAVGI